MSDPAHGRLFPHGLQATCQPVCVILQ